MTPKTRIGIIGGSGVYDLPGLEDIEEVSIQTPFGEPSDQYILGTVHGQRVAFLARHGRGHLINPTRVNYRANIWDSNLWARSIFVPLSRKDGYKCILLKQEEGVC